MENPGVPDTGNFEKYVRKMSRINALYIYVSLFLQIALVAGYFITGSLLFPAIVVPALLLSFYIFSWYAHRVHLSMTGSKMPFTEFLMLRYRLAVFPGLFSTVIYILFYPSILMTLWFRAVVAFSFNCIIVARIIYSLHRENLMILGKWRKTSRNLQLESIISGSFPLRGIPDPIVLIYRNSGIRSANASSVGIRRPVIMVAQSCVDSLSMDEMKGILSHEAGHAVNKDGKKSLAVTMSAITLAGNLTLYSWFSGLASPLLLFAGFLFFIFVYFRFLLLYMMRRFEIMADRYSAEECRQGENLVKGLLKLREINMMPRKLPRSAVTSHPDLDYRLREIWKHTRKD